MSRKTSWIYIGCTNDLEKRLKEHNAGRVYSTKKLLPVELIYYEAYKSKHCAYQREKSLKAFGSGSAKLKARLDIRPVLYAEKKIQGSKEGGLKKGRAG